VPVGGPPPSLGSYIQNGEVLTASKHEAASKTTLPICTADQDPRKMTWLIDRTSKPGNRWSGVALMIVRLVFSLSFPLLAVSAKLRKEKLQ
jgi:hypothetical protein